MNYEVSIKGIFKLVILKLNSISFQVDSGFSDEFDVKDKKYCE